MFSSSWAFERLASTPLFSILVDGIPAPLELPAPFARWCKLPTLGMAFSRAAAEFAYVQRRVDVGSGPGAAVASRLLQMAARDGRWEALPWRYFRNEYRGYTPWQRWNLRRYTRLPDLGPCSPDDDLKRGLTTLVLRGMIRILKGPRQDYLAPNEALLKCVARTVA